MNPQDGVVSLEMRKSITLMKKYITLRMITNLVKKFEIRIF